MAASKRCLIVGAGEIYDAVKPEKDDFVIACDGGYAYLEKNGVTPDLTVGDFDSLGKLPGGGYIELPKVKDLTDSAFGINEGIKRGCGEFLLFGCVGGRASHTLANLQLLHGLSKRGLIGFMFDKTEILTAVTDGTLKFKKGGGCLSVFAADAARGVTVDGCRYGLKNAVLKSDFPLGISNEITDVTAIVTVCSGTLFVVFDKKIPFPELQK